MKTKTSSLLMLAGLALATVASDLQAHVIWPTTGRVSTSYYSSRSYGYHAAIDLAAPSGRSIGATTYGSTSYRGYSGGYGNLVIVAHRSSYTSYYAHQSSFSTYRGESISHNETIGYVGSTGNSTGPHVHFEIRRYGTKLYIPASIGTYKTRGYTIPKTYSGL